MKTMNLQNAVSIVNSSTNMALALVGIGNGLKTRISPQLLEEIGNPEKVEVLKVDGSIVILPARDGMKSVKVGKNRYLYDAKLAAAIAKLAGIDFEAREANGESKSVRLGTYTLEALEDDENVKVAVISFDQNE